MTPVLIRSRVVVAALALAACAPNAATGDAGPDDADARGATDSGDGEAIGAEDLGADPCRGVSGVVVVDEDVVEDTTWCASADHYLLDAIVHVVGATLRIQPGVRVLAGNGGSRGTRALIVQPGGRLEAVGTPRAPIVFTSAQPPGLRRRGDWNGVMLLGEAPLNTPSGTALITALPPDRARYGGSDATYDCGTLRYVRLEYGGFELGGGNETNVLTLAGCGSATQLDYVQAHGGLDDGIELFGGTVNATHLILSGHEDDGLQAGQGYRGTLQHLLVVGGGGTDHALEMDNDEDNPDSLPQTHATVWNATLYGEGANGSGEGLEVAENAAATLTNVLIDHYPTNGCVDLDDAEQAAAVNAGLVRLRSFITGECETALELHPANTVDFMDPALANRFGVPGPLLRDPAAYDFLPAASADVTSNATRPTGLPADPDFDDSATYVGAFGPGGRNWTAGWTAFPPLR